MYRYALLSRNDKDAVFAIAESVFGNRAKRQRDREILGHAAEQLGPSPMARCARSRRSPTGHRTYRSKVTLKNAPEEMRFGAASWARLRRERAVVVLPGSALLRQSRPARRLGGRYPNR
jgi:hypothetical protein